MSYEPTTWEAGDVVTSAKLNKMEQGIASNGILIVHVTSGTLDKTWQEIHDADVCYIIQKYTNEKNTQLVIKTYINNSNYIIDAIESYHNECEIIHYEANSSNSYPERESIEM